MTLYTKYVYILADLNCVLSKISTTNHELILKDHPEITTSAPLKFGLTDSGYLLSQSNKLGVFDAESDFAVRVFDTLYGPIVTFERDGRLEFFHDHSCDYRTVLNNLIQKFKREHNLVTNGQDMFRGKFRHRDSVVGIEVEWESGRAFVLRTAKEQFERDSRESDSSRQQLAPLEQYVWWNEFPNCDKAYVPVTVRHITSLNIKTSPTVLNDGLARAMEHMETLIIK